MTDRTNDQRRMRTPEKIVKPSQNRSGLPSGGDTGAAVGLCGGGA